MKQLSITVCKKSWLTLALKNSIKTREDRLRDEQSRYQTLLKSSNDLVQRANEEYSQVEANSKKEILSLQVKIFFVFI